MKYELLDNVTLQVWEGVPGAFTVVGPQNQIPCWAGEEHSGLPLLGSFPIEETTVELLLMRGLIKPA